MKEHSSGSNRLCIVIRCLYALLWADVSFNIERTTCSFRHTSPKKSLTKCKVKLWALTLRRIARAWIHVETLACHNGRGTKPNPLGLAEVKRASLASWPGQESRWKCRPKWITRNAFRNIPFARIEQSADRFSSRDDIFIIIIVIIIVRNARFCNAYLTEWLASLLWVLLWPRFFLI